MRPPIQRATGDVMSDLNGRRAHVQSMEPAGEGNGLSTVLAEAPMAEILRYATDLRSMTSGRGTFSAEFDRYDPVPEHVAKKVAAAQRIAGRRAERRVAVQVS